MTLANSSWSPVQMRCSLTCVRTDARMYANTHTPKHRCVSILTWPLVRESSIPKTSEFQCNSARILDRSTQETLQVLHTRCFLMFAPVSKAFFTKKPTSGRLLIPSRVRASRMPSNCAGRLGNSFKSFLYWRQDSATRLLLTLSANAHTCREG